MWNKWRNRENKQDKIKEKNKNKEEILEMKLTRIEKALERVKEDEKNAQEQLKRETERRNTWKRRK